uniref:Uncharacterized protein n=1 Tax=Alloyangia mangrovi TaxID=1779329 RepID=A0A2A3JYX5_9RHOB
MVPGVLSFLLVACGSFPLTYTEFQAQLDGAPYVQQPLSSAWIRVPDAQLVLERRYRFVTEQRILLPNPTALRGENFILLHSEASPLSVGGRFRPTELLASAGGTPFPFERFEDLAFRTTADALGVMSWASWSNHAGLNCVLAFRRLDATARTLQSGTSAMDMMLRNCVHGSEDAALAPIGPEAVGFAAITAEPAAAPQMLSPLAGPLP